MHVHSNACDFERLSRLLDHELTAEEVAIVERHLSSCSRCQQQIKSLAGSEAFWGDVASRLSGQSFDDTELTVTPEENVGSQSSAAIEYLTRILAPTDDPKFLGRLGTYEVIGLIGVGGMGIVIKAFDPVLSRHVAIKILHGHLAANGAARQRFLREAKASAAVVHENVLAIYAIEEWNGLSYFVMPLILGGSLDERIRIDGYFEAADVLRVLRQIAAGLAHAHEQGLVHRDIKPANILLDQGSLRLKISDFGLARAANDASLTRSGTISGTPLYMSPEQARGERVDARSDIFSLGSLAYTMCTGHPPFRAETPFGVMRRITDDSPRAISESNPTIPDWLIGIIERMLAKDPETRIQTASDLAQIFTVGLNHLQQSGDELPSELACFANNKTKAQSPLVWLSMGVAVTLLGVLAFVNWPTGIQSSSKNNPVTESSDSTASRTRKGIEDSQPDINSVAEPIPLDLATAPNEPEMEQALESDVETSSLPELNHYRFEVGERQNYIVKLNVEYDDVVADVTGTLVCEVLSVNSESAELKYLFESEANFRSRVELMIGPIYQGGQQAIANELRACERPGRIRVLKTGGIAGRSTSCDLPGQLGSLLDLVYPRIVDEHNAEFVRRDELDLAIPRFERVIGPTLNSTESIFVRRELRHHYRESVEGDFLAADIVMKDTVGELAVETKGGYKFNPRDGQIESVRLKRSSSDQSEIEQFANVELQIDKSDQSSKIHF